MVKKILCVDDDLLFLRSLKRMLRNEYEFTSALDGKEALLKMHEEGPFDIVLSDFCMPGINGVDLLKKIKETWPDTACVILTGCCDIDTAMNAIDCDDIVEFLFKPCPSQTLLRVLKNAS